MSASRTLMVPDGLAGERVDVGISRMLGLSRTRAAELVTAGHVLVDGQMPARSTRLEPGAMVDVELPDEKPAVEVARGASPAASGLSASGNPVPRPGDGIGGCAGSPPPRRLADRRQPSHSGPTSDRGAIGAVTTAGGAP